MTAQEFVNIRSERKETSEIKSLNEDQHRHDVCEMKVVLL